MGILTTQIFDVPWKTGAASSLRRMQELTYPFVPVSAIPWMKYRWPTKKMLIRGTIVIVVPAISKPHSVKCMFWAWFIFALQGSKTPLHF